MPEEHPSPDITRVSLRYCGTEVGTATCPAYAPSAKTSMCQHSPLGSCEHAGYVIPDIQDNSVPKERVTCWKNPKDTFNGFQRAGDLLQSKGGMTGGKDPATDS